MKKRHTCIIKWMPFIKKLYLGCAIYLLLSNTVSAGCYINSSAKPVVEQPSFVVSALSAGNDLPDGTVIYRQTVQSGHVDFKVKCDPGRDYYLRYAVNLPNSFKSGRFDHVYPTSVSGIGVVFWYDIVASGAGEFPLILNNTYASAPPEWKANSGEVPYSNKFTNFDFFLVKTGPIDTVGGTQQVTLPEVHMFAGAGTSTGTGLSLGTNEVQILTASFSGGITISKGSCNTPSNVNVEFGTVDLATFKNIGDTSEWIKKNIVYTDCPISYPGYYDADVDFNAKKYAANFNTVYEVGNKNPLPATITSSQIKNKMALTIDSNDKESMGGKNNVIKIKSSGSGNAASGVGIELEWDDGTAVDLGVAKQVNPPVGSGTLVVPFKARYRAVADKVTPGEANGTATFTLNYK